MLQKILPHPITSLVFILALVFALLNQQVVFADPDTLWHIRAGDLIREHGITTREPWSWTAGDYAWINIAWLPDIVMSWLHQLGGLPLVKHSTLLLFAIILSALAAIGLRLKATPTLLAIPLFYTAGIVAEGMLARPQLLSLLFAIAAYATLRFAKDKWLWLLLPLEWLWTNSHGGYIALFILMGLFAIELWHRKNHRRLKILITVGTACVAVIFINPYGTGIMDATLAVLGTQANTMLHEWQPTAPAQYLYLLGWLLLLVIAGGMQNKAIPLADKLLVIFWLVMAMMSIRMTYLAAIFSFPYLILSLKTLSEQVASLRSPPAITDTRKARLAAGLAAILSTALLFSPIHTLIAAEPTLPAKTSPAEELEFIAAHYPNLRFFTHYNFGGYIIYRRDLGIKPFIDGRAETAYPKNVISDYFTIQQMNEGWQEVAAKRDIQGLLIPLYNVEKQDEAALQIQILDLRADWKRVFTGKTAAVYVRRDVMP